MCTVWILDQYRSFLLLSSFGLYIRHLTFNGSKICKVSIIWCCVSTFLNSALSRHERRGQTITSEAKQREFQETISDAARPFLAARTDRFVNEVELFLASGLNIEAYDAVCMQRLGWSAHGVITEAAAEGELAEHRPAIPYLHIFDDFDSSD